MMGRLQPRRVRSRGLCEMSKIENYLASGERIVYRARFGGKRILFESVAGIIGLTVGALLGPVALLIAVLIFGAWLYGERVSQTIVVTNQRLIHKKPRFGFAVHEIALTQIESIKSNGQRLVVHGTGGTRLKLPDFLQATPDFYNALRNVDREVSNMEGDMQSSVGEGPQPFWRRHKFITGLGIYLALSALIGFSLEDETEAVIVVAQAVQQTEAVSSDIVAGQSQIVGVSEEISFGSSKRSLNVRISEVLDEATLTTIAKQLQSEKPNFERTYIEYYLPGMDEDTGAWASTHFDPNLKVRIFGLTVAQLKDAANDPTDANLVGRWIAQANGYTISINKEGRNLMLIRRYADGSEGRDRMKERSVSRGKRYDFIERSDTGDYFMFLKNGFLAARDDQGLIFMAPPL